MNMPVALPFPCLTCRRSPCACAVLFDPAVIALEQQAAAHVRAIQQHAARYMTAIRYGDPVLAQVEMGDVARRMVQCEMVVDRLAAQLSIDAPELRDCLNCGARECDCCCDRGLS